MDTIERSDAILNGLELLSGSSSFTLVAIDKLTGKLTVMTYTKDPAAHAQALKHAQDEVDALHFNDDVLNALIERGR